MPATSRRPAPSARMVDLLAAAKRTLIANGFDLERPEDPAAFARAVAVDRERTFVRAELDEMIEAKAGREALAAKRGDLAVLDREFADLLAVLPAFAAFEAAWERSWQTMVQERAWPHATKHRRAWRLAMRDCKPETRACFLGLPTGYSRYIERIAERMLEAMSASEAKDHGGVGGTLMA